jgi:type VI protein secretion system component VasK
MTTSSSPRPSRPWATLGAGAAAVVACAVCCAGPVLAVLGSIGAASTVAAIWVPALAVLAVAAVLGVLFVIRRRRAACHSGPQVVDLGMPTAAAAEEVAVKAPVSEVPQ